MISVQWLKTPEGGTVGAPCAVCGAWTLQDLPIPPKLQAGLLNLIRMVGIPLPKVKDGDHGTFGVDCGLYVVCRSCVAPLLPPPSLPAGDSDG